MTTKDAVSLYQRQALGTRILHALKKYWLLYLFALPGMMYFLIYKIVPIFGVVIAFKNFSISRWISSRETCANFIFPSWGRI